MPRGRPATRELERSPYWSDVTVARRIAPLACTDAGVQEGRGNASRAIGLRNRGNLPQGRERHLGARPASISAAAPETSTSCVAVPPRRCCRPRRGSTPPPSDRAIGEGSGSRASRTGPRCRLTRPSIRRLELRFPRRAPRGPPGARVAEQVPGRHRGPRRARRRTGRPRGEPDDEVSAHAPNHLNAAPKRRQGRREGPRPVRRGKAIVWTRLLGLVAWALAGRRALLRCISAEDALVWGRDLTHGMSPAL